MFLTMLPLSPLPIDPLIPEILAALEKHPNLVLQASPGSGKTTRVPPALLEASWLKSDREILVLVPRRLAAKLAAYRVAEERGEEVGKTVGYQFRSEKVIGPRTRLKFLTEGMLLRIMMSDPTLARAGLIILDEFHERHLHSDIALSYLSWLQKHRRPDLKLAVMSATLETDPLARFLSDAEVLKLESPLYPVQTEYQPSAPKARVEEKVAQAVKRILQETGTSGDILVFLPGMAEILRCAEKLSAWRDPGLKILPLHGELPREAQSLVFKKFRERKVILATNVAESSLTIEGVTAVVDTGLARQANFSWWSGVPSLKTKSISQASAIQRAGRAGRTAPGLAVRLYSAADFQGRPAFELPEIQRADLAQTVLELKSLLGFDLAQFPWFEAPKDSHLGAAVELLYYLGALVENHLRSRLTDLGRRMAELPLHPRLSRILLTAESQSTLPLASRLAAQLSENHLEHLDVLEGLEKSPPQNVRRLEAQLLTYFRGSSRSHANQAWATNIDDLGFAVLTGFPDRVAQRRATVGLSKAERTSSVAKEFDLVFSFGGSGTIPAESVATAGDLFVVLDVQERQALGQERTKVHVHSVCPIEEEWLLALQPSKLVESRELAWDSAQKKVVQIKRLQYDQLVLEETKRDPPFSEAVERVFISQGLGLSWERVQGPDFHPELFFQALQTYLDIEMLEAHLVRLELFAKLYPECGLPTGGPAAYREGLLRLLRGITRSEELRNLRPESLLEALPGEYRSRLDALLPLQIQLQGGRSVKVHYELGKGPWLASRLQDFFGMRQGPSLMAGNLPLALHLLAPNQRAVQVTSDLQGFWERHYPKIRQELRRRYPKHAWPENPLELPRKK